MKIAIFEVKEKDREFFRTYLVGYDLVMTDKTLSKENASECQDADIVSIRSFSQLTADVLTLLPDAKLIASRTTGVDHIDLSYCKDHGIAVSNVPGYGQYTVAEHSFALLLAISRNVIPSVLKAKDKDFSISEIMGFELHGKILGVIGAGSIGRSVIKVANAFGMQVIVNTKDPDESEAVSLGYINVSLEALLTQSDVITLHVPYTSNTHHLIDKESIAKMRTGVVIINTARGAIIDTTALVEGLRSGKIKAAGLDVLEHERDFTHEEHELFSMPNVIITPHNAFNSIEALERILKITVENIASFLRGTPQNVV